MFTESKYVPLVRCDELFTPGKQLRRFGIVVSDANCNHRTVTRFLFCIDPARGAGVPYLYFIPCYLDAAYLVIDQRSVNPVS